MKITKYEQSGFIFESRDGVRLALDIGSFTLPERTETIAKVDTVVVSHIHPDHFSLPNINALNPMDVYLNRQCMQAAAEGAADFTATQISPSQTVQSGPFSIISFEVNHGPNAPQPLIDNQGFIINVDGKRIYFAGDMYYPSGLPPETLDVDVALVPVGTHYTFGPKEALDFALRFNSIGQLVPMHYEMNKETCGEFIGLVGGKYKSTVLQAGESIEL